MLQEYTNSAINALKLAEKTARRLHQNYVGTEHLLVGLLKENEGVASKILQENGVKEEKLIELIKELIAPESIVMLEDAAGFSPKAKDVLEESAKQAIRFHAEKIGTEHILLAVLKESENIAVRILNTMNVSIQKIYVGVLIAMGEDSSLYNDDFEGSGKKKQEATSTLNQFSRDLTALAEEGKLDPVIGRDEEILRLIQILSRRTKNNPCLVGEPGVGKTAIVEGLALRIFNGDVPLTVQHKRVVTLDLSAMVAGSKYRGEFEERIKKVIKEVIKDGNIILFLDEVHTIIGAGGAEGAIDASNILKPSLARGEIQLIGATTIDEYRKYIEKDAALERRFQPIQVEEPTQEETIKIIEGIASLYEKHHGVQLSADAIQAAVSLSSRYINDRNLPDKAIDLIDEASAAKRIHTMGDVDGMLAYFDKEHRIDEKIMDAIASGDMKTAAIYQIEKEEEKKKFEKTSKRKKTKQNSLLLVVTKEDIAEVVARWTKIPVKKIAEKESLRLLKLEDILHKRVVGQEEAVMAVAKAIRRGRVGLQDPTRPIGSFLFLGPTGVGKTELSKALAETMFGSDHAVIRVDMSEFMEQHSVAKLIGSPPGYVGFDDGGQLCEKVRRNPYSVVLFDEVEKAHPDVFNVLLQVLDEGHITDSKGRKVSFKNTIVIMTSNAGAQKIVTPKNLGFTSGTTAAENYDKMKSGVMEEVKKLFKPEFINRIDEIMVFHPLTKENMHQITTLLVNILKKRCKEQMNISLTVTNSMKKYLVDKFTDVKMGARPLKRAVQSQIEDALAEEILKGNIIAGDTVHVIRKNDETKFIKK